MHEILQIVTTTDTEKLAQELGASLVEHRLAACVQVDGPIRSIYRWKNQVETAEEWRCTMKTTAEHFDDVKQHIRSLHNYDVPEIIASEICCSSSDYAEWLRQQVAPRP